MIGADEPTWLAHYNSESDIRAVVEGLLDGSWPESDWKHREHCVATLGLIVFYPDIDLDRDLPGIIQRYNVAQGGENTDQAGYHHTITLLYLAAIRVFLKSSPAAADVTGLTRRLLQSPLGTKDYPLRFYSRARLFSVEARRGWVAPDLEQPEYPISPA